MLVVVAAAVVVGLLGSAVLVVLRGARRRLLDEVDVISAVSGGTLPAAYYGLRGERTFEEFPARVLYRNLEADLVKRILSPANWFRLPSGTFGKSDLFAEIYDETVFGGATFAEEMGGWVRDGQVVYREDVTEGLENVVEAFTGMLAGRNFGKVLVKVS